MGRCERYMALPSRGLRLRQLGPDQMPVVGAKSPAIHVVREKQFHRGRPFGGDRAHPVNPLVYRGDGHAEQTSERSLTARKIAGSFDFRDFGLCVHDAIIRLRLIIVNRHCRIAKYVH